MLVLICLSLVRLSRERRPRVDLYEITVAIESSFRQHNSRKRRLSRLERSISDSQSVFSLDEGSMQSRASGRAGIIKAPP